MRTLNIDFVNADKSDVILADTQELDRKLLETQRTLYNLEEEKKEIQKGSCIKCRKCSTISQIRNLGYRQIHYYVRPSGCTEGDYWAESAGEVICPNCKIVIRLYDIPKIMELKWLFKNIDKVYDHR